MKKHIVTVSTVKGGTGKTTTAGALAEAAALSGRRVLAIDLDPQGALSVWYQAAGAIQTAYNAFSGGELSDAIRETGAGFDLIPASGNLFGVESSKKYGNRDFEEALEPLKRRYDFIIVDAPPSMGRLMNNALFSANEILCPLEADIASLRGFQTTIDIINQARAIKRNMRIIGAVICQYDARPNIRRDMLEVVKEEAASHKIPFLGTVRKCTRVPEAQAIGKPLYQHAPKCTTAEDYLSIFRRIIGE